MLSIAPLVWGRARAQSHCMEVVDMQSPYLSQVLAEAHIADLHRAAARSARGRARRRPASSLPRIRAWWGGQLRRPAGDAARTAVLPGRPVAPVVACTLVGR